MEEESRDLGQQRAPDPITPVSTPGWWVSLPVLLALVVWRLRRPALRER
jgi:MYXO-CTERM domain-containing protein